MTDQATHARLARVDSDVRSQPKFFAWMSGLMFLGILIGFWPTFFFSAYFPVERLPPHLIFHGTVLTLWFGLYFFQTTLVAMGRKRLHARLGPYIVAASIVVIVASISASLRLVSRLLDGGADLDTLVSQGVITIWNNTAMLLAFITCLGLGVYFRSAAETHKRLMLVAFISLYLPATVRISRLPRFFDAEQLVVPSGGAYLILLLLLALCAYDLLTRGRIHMVSALGTLALITLFFAARLVSSTDFAGAMIRFLA